MVAWELAASIAELFGITPLQIPQAIGVGIPFAFGHITKLHDKAGEEVPINQDIAQIMADTLSSREVIMRFLTGNNEVRTQSAIGQYAQNSEVFVKRSEEFRKTVSAYDKSLHKRAYVGSLTLAMQPDLSEILAAYGKSFQDFLNVGHQRLMAFFESVPSLDVEIELVVERNENWDKKVHVNDKTDIAFLSVAIPYCDVVVTERFWKFSARKRKLDSKYHTVVTDDLNDLLHYLP